MRTILRVLGRLFAPRRDYLKDTSERRWAWIFHERSTGGN